MKGFISLMTVALFVGTMFHPDLSDAKTCNVMLCKEKQQMGPCIMKAVTEKKCTQLDGPYKSGQIAVGSSCYLYAIVPETQHEMNKKGPCDTTAGYLAGASEGQNFIYLSGSKPDFIAYAINCKC